MARRTYDDDDGRTIADMNVEGMPWYDRSRRRGRTGDAFRPDPAQRRSLILGVLAAVLLVTLVFGGAYFLVILLMSNL